MKRKVKIVNLNLISQVDVKDANFLEDLRRGDIFDKYLAGLPNPYSELTSDCFIYVIWCNGIRHVC